VPVDYLSEVLTGPAIVDAWRGSRTGTVGLRPVTGESSASFDGAGGSTRRTVSSQAEILAHRTWPDERGNRRTRLLERRHSIKTYIRSAYRKVGVGRQTELSTWRHRQTATRHRNARSASLRQRPAVAKGCRRGQSRRRRRHASDRTSHGPGWIVASQGEEVMPGPPTSIARWFAPVGCRPPESSLCVR